MRIIVAGAGRAGLAIAGQLRTLGHEVTVIDKDAAASTRAFEEHGVVALGGDATDGALLREAGAAAADVVVAMLHRDADNLAVALLARSSGARRVMVRVRDPAYGPLYVQAGVQRTLSEVDVLLSEFVTAIEFEPVRHSMTLGGGRSVAFELLVPEKAAVAGRAVRDVAADPGFPSSCVIAGIEEPDGDVIGPRGTSVIPGGAVIVLVTRRAELGAAVAFFMRETK